MKLKYTDIRVGDKESFSKTITEKDILDFAEISSDFNPIHIDEAFARKSLFKTRIAHGMLVASLISTVMGCLIQKKQISDFIRSIYGD